MQRHTHSGSKLFSIQTNSEWNRNHAEYLVFCHLQQIECNFDVCRERLRVQFAIMNCIRNLIRNWFHFNGLQRFGFTWKFHFADSSGQKFTKGWRQTTATMAAMNKNIRLGKIWWRIEKTILRKSNFTWNLISNMRLGFLKKDTSSLYDWRFQTWKTLFL